MWNLHLLMCRFLSFHGENDPAEPNNMWRGKRSQKSASDLHTPCVLWADTHPQLMFHFPIPNSPLLPAPHSSSRAAALRPFSRKGIFLAVCVRIFLIHIRVENGATIFIRFFQVLPMKALHAVCGPLFPQKSCGFIVWFCIAERFLGRTEYIAWWRN